MTAVEYPRPADVKSRPVIPADHTASPVDLDSLPSVWTLDAEIEWLIDGVLPLAGLTLLSAASGTGKTWLAHAIAGAVAHGQPFLGREVKQRRVRYFDGENPAAIVQRNLRELHIPETPNLGVWGGWLPEPPPRPDDPRVMEYASKHQPLLIWDSLVHFHTGDEQSSTEIRAFMKHFRALAHVGATVLILHHTGKAKSSKQYRGSSDIPAVVDMAFSLDGQPQDGALHRLTMKNFKSRFAPSGQAVGMDFRSGEGFEAVAMPGAAPRVSVAAVVEEIISAHPGLDGNDIVDRAKGQAGKHAVRRYLKDRPSRAGAGRTRLYDPLPEARP